MEILLMLNQAVPASFAALFWDVNINELDLLRHRSFIIERFLNMGNESGIKWLWHTYAENDVLEIVKTSRKLSKKTARCWQNYFDLREEEMKCFSTYSMSPDNYY